MIDRRNWTKAEEGGGITKMQDFENTQYFRVETEPETGVKIVLATVYEALTEKGYKDRKSVV